MVIVGTLAPYFLGAAVVVIGVRCGIEALQAWGRS